MHRGSPRYSSPLTFPSWGGNGAQIQLSCLFWEGAGSQTIMQSMYLNLGLTSHGLQCFTPEKVFLVHVQWRGRGARAWCILLKSLPLMPLLGVLS